MGYLLMLSTAVQRSIWFFCEFDPPPAPRICVHVSVVSELLSVWYVTECVTIVVRRFYIDTIDCDDKRFYDTILSAINADLWKPWQYMALYSTHTHTRTHTDEHVFVCVCVLDHISWFGCDF